VLANLSNLNFSDEEITLMEDPSYDEINIFMRELALRTAKLTAANKKLLVLFYFAGHGI